MRMDNDSRSHGGRTGGYSKGPGGRMGRPGGKMGKMGGKMGKRRERTMSRAPKGSRLAGSHEKLDYKNVALLQKFVSDRGKIVSRRMSGITAKEQRKIGEAIKQARYLALIPTGGVKK